jgi:UDP-glucuronate 4-epimerase
MSHTLVTGGAGFIGSHLVDLLLSDGEVVTVLDNFDPFYDRRIKEHNLERHRTNPRCKIVESDVRDLAAMRRVISQDVDVIVHLAAKAGVRPSIENPIAYQDANVYGTQNLLEIAREREIPQFVFASSSSVYGVNPRVPWSEDDHVLQPISPYASTKVSESSSVMCTAISTAYGSSLFVFLRCTDRGSALTSPSTSSLD